MVTLLLGREVGRQRVVQLRNDLGARARAHAQQLQYQLLEHTVVQPLGPHVLPVSTSGSRHLGRDRELGVAPPHQLALVQQARLLLGHGQTLLHQVEQQHRHQVEVAVARQQSRVILVEHSAVERHRHADRLAQVVGGHGQQAVPLDVKHVADADGVAVHHARPVHGARKQRVAIVRRLVAALKGGLDGLGYERALVLEHQTVLVF